LVPFLAAAIGCGGSGNGVAGPDGGAGSGGRGGAGGGEANGAGGDGGTSGAGGGGTNGGAAGFDGGAGGAGGGGGSDAQCSAVWGGDLLLGTAADDQILGMTADDDGNIFVSGYEQGIVGVSANNIDPDGDARAIVAKLAPTGAVLWKAVLDTPATDTAEDVAVDRASGNLVVAGRTSGAFPTFVNQGQFDIFLALLDPAGNPLTVFQTGNERPQHPARLSLGSGGAVTMAGWDDTYIPSNYVAANEDGLLADFTIGPAPHHAVTLTSLQYTITPPSANAPFSYATGVAAARDGSGDRFVTFSVPSNTHGSHGNFVSRLRPDQSSVWTDLVSDLPVDAVTAVALSPAGDLFVIGGTFLTLGAQAFGQEDAFLVELDKDTGALVWAAQAGGPDSDYPTALAFDAAGNIYVAGTTLGSVVAGVTNQGQADVFVMKFSPAGALLSAWQTGTSADDQATSLAVDRCGNAFVGGYTRGAIVPGRSSLGGEDMFVLEAKL
jgi:hypothetical protein